MYTTAEYLDSLQQDLLGTIVALGLDPTTKFTDIKDMAIEGEITVGGGGNLSEYFNYQPITVGNSFLRDNFLLKSPDLTIPAGTTSLSYLASNSVAPIPKIICDNSVTNMSSMYFPVNIQGQTTFDLSGLNTSNVTDMSSMFRGCNYVTGLDFSTFNTSKLVTASRMFQSCTALTSVDLSGKDFTKVNYVDNMFDGCTSLTTVVLPDFGNSNDKLYNFQSTFNGCTSLTTSDYTALKSFLYLNSCNGMFNGCTALTKIDLSNLYTSTRVNCSTMFNNCSGLTEIDMRSFDFSKISSQTNMFGDATYGVPNNCLIIVGTNDDKTWINNKFSRLTNVKTVAEL